CSQTAVKCLQQENMATYSKCIQINLECASITRATAELLALKSAFGPDLCTLCADICKICADECDLNANSSAAEILKQCAAACREASRTCMIIFSEDSALPGIPQMTV